MKDFPAAHSMDSTWFAVDEDGNVAVFDTGEGGCFPEGDFPVGGEVGGYSKQALEESGLLARVLLARAQSDERLRALLPDRLSKLEDAIENSDAGELFEPLLQSLGVWIYDCEDPEAVPYERGGVVPQPIHVDELDEDTRRRFRNALLPVRFREAPLLAPGEFLPVQAWGPVWFDRQGHPHPTADQEKEFARIAADLPELGEIKFKERKGKILAGEALYAAVRKVVGDADGKKRRSGGGKASWWRRFLG